jgi:adenosylcobinamide-GDP ribazoletransferase
MTEETNKTDAGADALADKKKGTEVEEETGWLWHVYLRLPSRSTGPFRYVRDFFTSLEFLTRIRVTKRDEWFPDDFARSVPFFPWTGLIMGALMWGALIVGLWLQFSGLLLGIFLTVAELLFLGTLMYDGFMDTCDGIFSGRTRARKLEIMQDSHVGANAVIGAVLLILAKVSLFSVLPLLGGGIALLTMYILTRTLMTVYILAFPNARHGGLGEMFKLGGSPWYMWIAIASAVVLIYAIGGTEYLLLAAVTAIGCLLLAWWVRSSLGGLTGDTFGFLTELGDLLYLLILFSVARNAMVF